MKDDKNFVLDSSNTEDELEEVGIEELQEEVASVARKVATDAYAKSQARKRKAALSNTVIRDKKIGRNEPCPCGSGIKYKKCCIPGLNVKHQFN